MVQITAVLVFLISLLFSLDGRYNCFISRIPIFCYGIFLYKRYENTHINNKDNILSLFLSISILTFIFCQSQFLLISMLSPFIMECCMILYKWYKDNTNYISATNYHKHKTRLTNLPIIFIPSKINLKFIGKHSLELFLANCFVGNILNQYFDNSRHIFLILLFLAIQICASYIYVKTNNILTRIVSLITR